MTLIFAHRGSAGTHPENTLEAFYEADKVGADGIELDVQLTKDGEVVVIHDETVDRTTSGKGFVKDLTLKEMQQLDASYKNKKVFKKHTIPSLREVFAWLKTNNLYCNIELKNNVMDYPGLEKKVIEIIREFEMEHRIIISSFNHYSIVRCYQLEPRIEIAPLFSSTIYQPWVYAQTLRAKSIHPNIRAATDEIIKIAEHNGIAVRPYTINKEPLMKRLFQVSCSAFFTDYPERALNIKSQLRD